MKWVVFCGEDWGRHKSTGQFLAAELAKKDYKVLWVNSLGLRTPSFNKADILRIFNKFWQFTYSSIFHTEVKTNDKIDNIITITPLAIPLLNYHLIRYFNRFLLNMYLHSHIKRLNITSPIVITSCVSSVDILDDFNPLVKVYYCADEYSTMTGMDRELVKKLERELLKKVDLVVVSSNALLRRKKQYHSNVKYLPHGVNFEIFHKAVTDMGEIPADLRNIKGIKIGFVGLIGEHIDMEILDYLAANKPDINVILVGPIEQNTVIPQRKNIHLLGKKTPNEIPLYLRNFDICIIPYKQNERIEYVNPTKLREYLAAGCPVVSTPQKEAQLIDAPINFAETKEEFVNQINKLLSNIENVDRINLSNKMREHDWSSRAMEFNSMIKEVCDNSG